MANSAETKVQVLLDKLQVLTGSGGFETMSAIDRKLLLQYVSQLKESLQVLIGSPEPTSVRVQAPVEDNPRVEAPPLASQPVTPAEPVIRTTPQPSLPEEVLRELSAVKRNRELYEKTVDDNTRPDERTKSVNTVAREKQQVASLHERFAESGNVHLADQIKKGPLANLRTGISLNDKIWFVKELFGGNNEAYESAVHQLDGASSFRGAAEMCDAWSATHNWSASNLGVTKFMGFVRRRFPQ